MLKIYSIFLCLTGAATITICSNLPSFIEKESIQNIHFNYKNSFIYNRANLWGHNAATMSDYGPIITALETRRARLNIYMTGYSYAYFLAEIKANKNVFIDRLLGPEITGENPDWLNVQHEIYDQLSHASTAKGLDPTFFYNLFKNWLKSERGWESFLNVFTGINLKNNIYKMPIGYNQEKAEMEFRKKGIIMQFYFVPTTSGNWKVVKLPIIFPNISQIIGLKQYYRHYSRAPESKWEIPILPIEVENPDHLALRSVGECIPNIIKGLTFYLNLSQQLLDEKRVSIDPNEKYSLLYYNPDKKTLLHLDFWYNNGTSLYDSQPIEMYLFA